MLLSKNTPNEVYTLNLNIHSFKFNAPSTRGYELIMSQMGHNDNLTYIYQYQGSTTPLHVRSSKLFMPQHDQVLFYFSDPKLTGGSNSRPQAQEDDQTDIYENESNAQAGFMKVDYTTALVQQAEVPIIKSGEVLGVLMVNQAVTDLDEDKIDKGTKECLANVEEQVKSASLTGNKQERVKSVWQGMVTDYGPVNLGVLFFKNALMLTTKMHEIFPKFQNSKKIIESEKLKNNGDFKTLVGNLTSAISYSIMLMDKPAELKNLLKDQGKKLSNDGIPKELFEIFGNAFIATVKSAAKDDCSIETLNFFGLFFNQGINLLSEGYSDLNKERQIIPEEKIIKPQKYFNLDLKIENFVQNYSPQDDGQDLILSQMNEIYNISQLFNQKENLNNLNRLIQLKQSTNYDYLTFQLVKPERQKQSDQTKVLQSGQVKINKPSMAQSKLQKIISDSMQISTNGKILGSLNINYKFEQIEFKDVKERIAIDVKSQLNAEKIDQVKQVWEKVLSEHGVEHVGQLIFKNIFTLDPNAGVQFTNFQNIPMEKLFDDARFKKHAAKVVNDISDTVNNMKNKYFFEMVLQNIGHNYQQYGIPKEAFPIFGNAISASLTGALGKQNSIEIQRVAIMFQNVVSEKIISGQV